MWAILFSIIVAISMFMQCKPVNAADRINIGSNNIYVLDQKTQKTRTEYSDGDFISVVLNYSGEIKSGQRIVVNWDSKDKNNKAYLTAISEEKDVYILDKNKNQKIKVGFCTVSRDKAVIVIDDGLPNSYKINGFFSFNLQVRNTDNKEHSLKVRFNNDEMLIKVMGNTTFLDEKNVFANVIPDEQMEKDYIEWSLPLSSKGWTISELSDGQEIDLDSIKFKILYKERHDIEYTLSQLRKIFPNLKLKVTNNKIYFNLNAKQLPKYEIVMSYRSKVTDHNQISFNNKVSLKEKSYQSIVPNTNLKIRINTIALDSMPSDSDNDDSFEKYNEQSNKADYSKIDYKNKNKDSDSSHMEDRDRNKYQPYKYNRYKHFAYKENWDDRYHSKDYKYRHRRVHRNKLPKTNEKNDSLMWLGGMLVSLSLVGMLYVRKYMI